MIIIFGAGGFVGTYLIDKLVRNGTEVVAVDIDNNIAKKYYEEKGIKYFCIDITKPEDFKQLPISNIEAIVQLACMQPANANKFITPYHYINTNVIGTLNCLEYCKENKIKTFLYTISNRSTQGMWNKGIIDENTPDCIKYGNNFTMFALSEIYATNLVEYYIKEFGLRGIIFRLPAIYGYGPHLEGYKDGEPFETGFMTFIRNAVMGYPIEVWGNLETKREFIYIKDVVSAIIAALENLKVVGLYNISCGKSITLLEEVQEIIEIFSAKQKLSTIVCKPEIQNSIEGFQFDISRAITELNWTPQYFLKEMLVDIKQELTYGQFSYLVKKRQMMLEKEKNDGKTN